MGYKQYTIFDEDYVIVSELGQLLSWAGCASVQITRICQGSEDYNNWLADHQVQVYLCASKNKLYEIIGKLVTEKITYYLVMDNSKGHEQIVAVVIQPIDTSKIRKITKELELI